MEGSGQIQMQNQNGIVNGAPVNIIANRQGFVNSKVCATATATHSRLAGQAMQFLEEGKFSAALQFLNACLGDTDELETVDLDSQVDDLIRNAKSTKLELATPQPESYESGISDEGSLIEKRCLVNMRLKRYTKVVQDTKKMLDFSSENPVAYKCLLAALCKMKKLEQANEIIRLWQKNSPRDLEMMECRTKLESLMVAVKNGIEAADAFSDVEDLLGLNYDWLLLRKSKDPQWKFRPLPTSNRCSFVLCLQYRFGHCSLGEKCPDAHGEHELEEWKKRYEIENVTRRISSLKIDDGSVYLKDLLAKIQTASCKKSILCEEDTSTIQVSCTSALHTTVQQRKFKKFTWKFTSKTSKPLSHISLLHEHHRQYFHISSCSFVGPSDSVVIWQSGKSDPSSQVIIPELSEAALAIAGGNVTSYKYKVKVVFTPEVYGNFRQSVVFDVGDEPKVMRNVSVDVVPSPDSDGDNRKSTGNDKTSSPVDINQGVRFNIPWNFGNAEMIDGSTGEKVLSDKLGFALMSNASIVKSESFMENAKDPLSKEHYKERMRFLLTQEERSRQEILAKYNVTTRVQLSEKYVITGGFNEGMTRYAIDGALYGLLNLFRDISEDTAVGRLILRSCNAVLLTKSLECRRKDPTSKLRVYFCQISDKSKNSVYLDLGKSCVAELGLREGDSLQFDIQFQLDRTSFIEQKRVIDQLEEKHLNKLFPDLAINCNIPWNPIKQWSEIENCKYRLNPKQKEALIAITAEHCETPPILVIGPFGSGKTFTLAQCIGRILTQPNTRVMVCTHSNSAADLYIKEYLDSWVKEGFEEARPLRIYYEMRNLSSVHPVVLQYCTVEALKFRPPTLEEVLNHRVIVVTLSTSYLLMEMNLPEGTFSHILLDEAAQAMESEAITPLMSAGKNTKLVLAGDHFQLSPELFSEEARNIHPSLLERLHALYPDTHPCKLMLCENYRSHSAIIQFVSDSFYTKKLECAKGQPVHDNFFPLTFFAARGEDVQDSESTSYYNMAEVFELTEKVSELISSWPEKWGDYRDENAIGVLTPYADQVSRIRSRLRKKGLHSVSVERVFNVQGKQFRAVFLSTVRTFRPWVRILPEAVGNEVDLGFFSSPKLLNTAFTRAQSLVAVVGDPVSLCSVGKCRRIWEDYIRICHESKSLFGITFLQLKQSILGVEMRLTWGLNPLANEFQPQKQLTRPTVPVHANNVLPPPHVGQQSQLYHYNKVRSRAPCPEPFGGYYVPPQQLVDCNQSPILPPQGAPIFHGGQPAVLVRPPYHGGIGILPTPNSFPPPYIAAPVAQWGQGVGPTMQLPHPQVHNIQWPNSLIPHPQPGNPRMGSQPRLAQYTNVAQPAFANVHGNQVIPHSGHYVNKNYTQPLSNAPNTNDVYSASNVNVVNSHYELQGSHGVHGVGPTSQSEYATGQPLYRRPPMQSNVTGYEDRNTYTQPPLIYDQFQHGVVGPRSQTQTDHKLTPDELSLITRALEQHASSGEPFHGDIQNLRSKLVQAASSGEAQIVRPVPAINSAPTVYTVINRNRPQGYQGSSLSVNSNHGHAANVFTPISQKSPAAPIGRSPYGSSSYQEVSTSTSVNSRIWSNVNSFPPLNDGLTSTGFSSHQGAGFPSDSNIQRDRGPGQAFADPSTRSILAQSATSNSAGQFKSLTMTAVPVTPHTLQPPLTVSVYNNNTLPSYYEPGSGYQADVGGLKAQLSGGLRHGFGERSAFSRVNGNQDVEVVTDNSGLGRSYANVVKAAVTTAVVGAFVSTSTMASNSSGSRQPIQPPSSGPVVSNQYNNMHAKFFGALGGPGAPHNQFGPY